MRLLDAGDDAIQSETDGIDGSLPGQLEFLAGGQWDGVVNVADIKIGNETQDALLLLVFDLVLRDFRRRGHYAQFGGGGGDHQGQRWNGEVLSGVQIPREGLRREARSRNCKVEGSRSDIGKRELPVIAGQNLLIRSLIFRCEPHPGSGDDSARLIGDRAGDAAWRAGIQIR